MRRQEPGDSVLIFVTMLVELKWAQWRAQYALLDQLAIFSSTNLSKSLKSMTDRPTSLEAYIKLRYCYKCRNLSFVVVVSILMLATNVDYIVKSFVNIEVAPIYRWRGGEKHEVKLISLVLEHFLDYVSSRIFTFLREQISLSHDQTDGLLRTSYFDLVPPFFDVFKRLYWTSGDSDGKNVSILVIFPPNTLEMLVTRGIAYLKIEHLAVDFLVAVVEVGLGWALVYNIIVLQVLDDQTRLANEPVSH